MKEEKVIKYLGDFLSSSLEEYVHIRVVKRASAMKIATYEIRSLIED